MRELLDPHRLHSVQVIHDAQTVEPEAAVGEVRYILDSEGVGPTVRNVQTRLALPRHIFVRAKDRPDTTHDDDLMENFTTEGQTNLKNIE